MNRLILLFALLILFLNSCSKEEKTYYTATGVARLVNEQGFINFDKINIRISSAGDTISIISNEEGEFTLNKLKTGTSYDIEFFKEGYGTIKLSDRKFFNGGKTISLGRINLYQFPSNKLISASLKYSEGYFTIHLLGNIEDSKQYRVLLYINDSIDVSETHFDHISNSTYASGMIYQNIELSVYMAYPNYPSGTTVYGALYFYNVLDDGYYDKVLYRYVYSSGKKDPQILTLTLP